MWPAEHVIEIGDAQPIKLPARPISFHFKEYVHTHDHDQLQEMANANQPINSP